MIYTMSVFGVKYVPTKFLKKSTQIALRCWGIQGWNPDSSHEPGRLAGSGSFTFPGMFVARQMAMAYLNDPNVNQVVIKTNQGRDVYRWTRNSGKISGYYTPMSERNHERI